MFLIAILTGIILGQYIRLNVDSTAIAFARTVLDALKGIDIKGTIEYIRLGPLERKVKAAFEQLEAEVATAAETTDKTPKATAAKTAKQSEKLTVKAE
jgi:hypothetical protein